MINEQTKKQADVMLASLSGDTIQQKHRNGARSEIWSEDLYPTWNWAAFDYRVKPVSLAAGYLIYQPSHGVWNIVESMAKILKERGVIVESKEHCGFGAYEPDDCVSIDTSKRLYRLRWDSPWRVQGMVSEWHSKIFSGRRPLATAKKCLEEASELHIAAKGVKECTVDTLNDRGGLTSGDVKSINLVLEECADVAIVCYALAGMLKGDLDTEIRKKLKTLGERTDQKDRDKERGIE